VLGSINPSVKIVSVIGGPVRRSGRACFRRCDTDTDIDTDADSDDIDAAIDRSLAVLAHRQLGLLEPYMPREYSHQQSLKQVML
jgi:hypothetical protein